MMIKLHRLTAQSLLGAITLCASVAALNAATTSAVSIATVWVNNAGNGADTTGFGSVGYNYKIGKYDVTVTQYTAFLNSVARTDTYGLYNPNMAGITSGNPGIAQVGSLGNYTYSIASGHENLPVTDVSFWNATRFANWLNNGQPASPEGAGTTETGTYNLLTTSIDAALAVTPTGKDQLSTSPEDNAAVVRSASATWAVTSENEWYKAAYFDPTLNAGGGGYYKFPTQGNTIDASQTNVFGPSTTPVGSYAYSSYYGTFDQGGNVYQWNENIDYGYNVRDVRGGAFDAGGDFNRLSSTDFTYVQPWVAYDSVGFRVSQVPEPVSAGLVLLAGSRLFLGRRRRSTTD